MLIQIQFRDIFTDISFPLCNYEHFTYNCALFNEIMQYNLITKLSSTRYGRRRNMAGEVRRASPSARDTL